MRAYPIELRERAVAAIDSGMSKWAVHKTFKVSRSTLDDWLRLRDEAGSLEAVTYQHGPKPAIADDEQTRAFFGEHSYKTLAELCELWLKRTGQAVSDVTMSKTLKRLGYTHKKRATSTENATKPNAGHSWRS